MKLEIWMENNRVCFKNGLNRFGSLTKEESQDLINYLIAHDIITGYSGHEHCAQGNIGEGD